MSIVIRQGNAKDLPILLSMIKELAEFEKEPNAVNNTIAQMQSEQDFFKFYVAEKDGDVAGIAVYYFAYFTWVGKSLYLDDLYVKPEYRSQQIGSKLLEKILDTAKKEQCKKVRWQVLHWNEEAIAFYKKYNAQISKEWLNCDVFLDL